MQLPKKYPPPQINYKCTSGIFQEKRKYKQSYALKQCYYRTRWVVQLSDEFVGLKESVLLWSPVSGYPRAEHGPDSTVIFFWLLSSSCFLRVQYKNIYICMYVFSRYFCLWPMTSTVFKLWGWGENYKYQIRVYLIM